MCTIIAIGHKASKDGSNIISHSDAGLDSRIRKIERQTHASDALAPVYLGIQDIRSHDLLDYGEIIGYIPQVEKTFSYFHSAYSHINEFQLAIAESTITQRDELISEKNEGEQIMTIEQSMVFALQRCKTPQEAIKLIGHLMETYGFLSSCGNGGECLCIGNPDEIWVMEIVGVGKNWIKQSGKPGAIWVAQKLENDQALIVANWSVIKKIDILQPDKYIACKHYQSFAENQGWYSENIHQAFIWQDIYSPLPREWATERLWLFYSTFAPNYYNWPDRFLKENKYKTIDQYTQVVEPISIYPFSVKPEQMLSVKNIITFQRSVFENTIYDITEQPAWYVANDQGQLVKSPLATPFPTPDLRRLLKLTNRRTVARHFGNYGMICQLRKNLPDDIAGIYWIYLDNPHISPYVPTYIGTASMPNAYTEYHPEEYTDTSARWCIDFVDNLTQLEYQNAIKDVINMRDQFETEIENELNQLDAELYLENNKEERIKKITTFNHYFMSKVPSLYIHIRNKLIVKYTNNKK